MLALQALNSLFLIPFSLDLKHKEFALLKFNLSKPFFVNFSRCKGSEIAMYETTRAWNLIEKLSMKIKYHSWFYALLAPHSVFCNPPVLYNINEKMACKDHIFIKVVQMSYFLKNGEDKLEIKCTWKQEKEEFFEFQTPLLGVE